LQCNIRKSIAKKFPSQTSAMIKFCMSGLRILIEFTVIEEMASAFIECKEDKSRKTIQKESLHRRSLIKIQLSSDLAQFQAKMTATTTQIFHQAVEKGNRDLSDSSKIRELKIMAALRRHRREARAKIIARLKT
jgi:hypothetical protein